MQTQLAQFSQLLVAKLHAVGLNYPVWFVSSVIIFSLIAIFQMGYFLMVTAQCWYAKMDKNQLLPMFGYGFIPLVLGGYMAVHLEFFVGEAGRLVPNIKELLGMSYSYDNIVITSYSIHYTKLYDKKTKWNNERFG